MLRCYFDDAGTHSNSTVLSYGGLVGNTAQWSAFEVEWRKILAAPMEGKPALNAFHLSHCWDSRGEFYSYKPAERDLIQNIFRQPIVQNGLTAISCSVSVPDWDELITGETRDCYGSAEDVAFAGCVTKAFHIAFQLGHRSVDIRFDEGRRRSSLVAMVERVRSEHCGEVTLKDISFEVVAKAPGLQGADIIATESNRFASETLAGDSNRSEHYKALLSRIGAAGFLLDRSHILQTLETFKREGCRSNDEYTPVLY